MPKNKRNVVTAKDKISFRTRLNAIEETIPENYRKQIIEKHPEILNGKKLSQAYSKISNVREGKQVDFTILGYLEDLAEEHINNLIKSTQSH